MSAPPNRSSEPDLFSSTGRESSSSSSAGPISAAVRRDTKRATSSQYILPKDLDTAIRQLDDKELDKLVSVALEERARRKHRSLPEERRQKGPVEVDAVPLPRGRLNAVKAAFKAGVTREFGISLSDVRKAIRH
jgi:hypothetical protein